MSPTLLPNLRRLHWLDNGEDQFPLSHYLLVSPITLMKLRPASWWTPSSTKSTLLTSLGTSRCPTIRELECVYQGDDSEFSDVICEAVCGLRELSHLRTGVLNPRALLHLASLPSLKCQYSRTYNYNSTQTNATPTFRAQLDQVDISSPSPSVLARCLRNIQFLSCRSVELYIGNADQIHSALPHGPLGIPELIISLSEYFSPTLERLSVTLFNKLPEPTLADLRSPYIFDVIAPFLSFMQSLPQLEEFYFGSRGSLADPAIYHFHGTRSPHAILQALETSSHDLDADEVDTFSGPFIPDEKITELFFGTSPIDDSLVMACQLHALLPNLTNVYYDFASRPPLEDFQAEWTSSWGCLL
ncbi:uncharacterized protein EDB91DRAFT_1276184 [Suillus paluster]|uniref:uncharacterized protein n=1 Tax=Suillus paluster TaxID=48578 RepID=UPI001B86CAF5|nr:uncharacterized protein EDB91DRAFT_1276184 [Suillus paluster]KAG1754814.1 hypothetical protein EDB91DRAFT_1276184 [Suillus paluster]